MTYYISGALSVGLALLSTNAMAQATFSGGEVSLGYAALTDSDLETSGFNLGLSGEISLGREFALQGDISYTDGKIGGFKGDNTTVAVHGIYHANENASFGLYYGQDRSEGEHIAFYGTEGGYENGPLELSGYFGVAAVDSGDFDDGGLGNIDFNQHGIAAAYQVNDTFAVTGRYDQIHWTEAFSVNRLGLGIDAAVAANIGVAAEFGRIEGNLGDGSADENYANLTATYTFGAKRGATFDTRGLLHTVLGF